MSKRLKTEQTRSVSVVIETVNEEAGPDIDLKDVLEGLYAQTYPKDKIEIIVVIDGDNRELAMQVRNTYPNVSVVESEASTYFSMKSTGIGSASGDVIALLDSDCIPSKVWVERIVAHIDDGADVVAGKTRYPKDAKYSRTFNFFNFGYIQADENGRANGFLPNNVAFSREVILQHNFDPRIRRGGAGHLLGNKLLTDNYRIDYEPDQHATHNVYGLGEELLMRVKSGYDTVNLCRLDSDSVIEESRFLRRGIWGLLPVFVRRVIFDVRATLMNRKDLDIGVLEIPYFLVISPAIRGLEMAAAILTVVRPDYFKKKYGW